VYLVVSLENRLLTYYYSSVSIPLAWFTGLEEEGYLKINSADLTMESQRFHLPQPLPPPLSNSPPPLTNPPSQLACMNKDPINIIAGSLPARDLCALAQTCRRLHSMLAGLVKEHRIRHLETQMKEEKCRNERQDLQLAELAVETQQSKEQLNQVNMDYNTLYAYIRRINRNEISLDRKWRIGFSFCMCIVLALSVWQVSHVAL
jgi:hypothetical protein